MSDAVPLPAILDTCGCDKRRGIRVGNHAHYSDCTIAVDFTAGEKAADQVRYGRSTRSRPGDASEAFLAGWDRAIDRKDGESHRIVSWTYPLHIGSQFGGDVDIEMDPVTWFTDRVEWYSQVHLNLDELGFEHAWEKPLAFITQEILNDREPHGTFHGGGAKEGPLGQVSDLGGIRFRWAWENNREWNAEDTHRLHQALGLEDADGNPTKLVLDPQRKPVQPPQTVDSEVLPLAGPGTIYTDRYTANVEFAMRYLAAAEDIRHQAISDGVDPAELTASLPGDRAVIALEGCVLASRWAKT